MISAALAVQWVAACESGTKLEGEAMPPVTGRNDNSNDAQQPWIAIGGGAAPKPAALVSVDYGRREINSSILVVGSGADDFLEHVYRTTAPSDAGGKKVIDASIPGEASFSYLPLRLGDIRGFKTWFHLYGFRSDERLMPLLEDVVPHVSGLIVMQKQADESEVVRAVANRLVTAGHAIPVAVLGPEEFNRSWDNIIASAPVFRAAMSEDAVFPALKAVAKEILMNLRKGPESASVPPSEGKRKPWWKFW